jgi:hypothetical protein
VEKKSVGLLELETAVLECFLEKTPLSPLGVKAAIHFGTKNNIDSKNLVEPLEPGIHLLLKRKKWMFVVERVNMTP